MISLKPALDHQIAVFVHNALVPGPEPTVGKAFGVGLGVIFITGGHIGPTNHYLSDASGG